MRSVLNEDNFFDTVIKAGQAVANSRNDSAAKSHYLGGSISRYTKGLTLSFPMLCDNTLSIDTAQLISKASEKNIVSMLQMMFASMHLEGNDGVEVLRMLHMNLDADIEDIINAMNKFAEGCEGGLTDAQIRDIINEMTRELKMPQKSFPAESLNERSINDYQVRNMNGNMVVMEYNDPYASDKNKREEEKANREKSKEEREKEQGKNREEREAIKAQILDSDFRKANEMQPTSLIVKYTTTDKSTVESFVCGVKSRMVGAESTDIVERIVGKQKSSLSFKNLIRATTGEISLFKDFVFALNRQKINAKNAAKRGYAAQMWNLLEKRATANSFNKLRKKGNDASAITSLVINSETVNYMLSNYRFDLNNPKNAAKVMDDYNLLAIFIADEADETVKFMYDGNHEFEIVAYATLAREARESKAYKDTVNLINKTGR